MENFRNTGHSRLVPDDRAVFRAIEENILRIQRSTSADVVGIDPLNRPVQRTTETRSGIGKVLQGTLITSIKVRDPLKNCYCDNLQIDILRFILRGIVLRNCGLDVLFDPFFLHFPLTTDVQPLCPAREYKQKKSLT